MKHSLAELSTFATVAKNRSFRRASVELGVSPSAVSHSVRQLENRLGLRLINRTTRSLSLTEAGQRLYESLSPLFSGIDEAVGSLSTLRENPVGTLRITATRLAARLYLAKIATDFLRQYPEMRLEISSEDRLVDVVKDNYDAGVRLGEVVSQNMVMTPLSPTIRFAIAATPQYLATKGSPPRHPRDLVDFDCLSYRFPTSEQPFLWRFEQGGEALEIDIGGRFFADDSDVVLDAALNNGGIGYFYYDQIVSFVNQGRLITLIDEWMPNKSRFYLYYPRSRNASFGFRAFLAFVKDQSRGTHRTPDNVTGDTK